ncbi:MAG: ATP-grasp domain-containing protein [Cyanobacteria bacterium SBLK]|nr:ATP-grasp domain-containing protein [Cyanobacteria bacterium SBLK]
MIRQIFLQECGNGKLDPEGESLYREFKKRDYPITLFTPKQLHRRRLKLDCESLLAGEIPIVLSALKQLKISFVKIRDYPNSLEQFFHRRIWQSSLGKLETRLHQGRNQPIFAKPANRSKRFTGKIFDSFHDLWVVSEVSRQEKIWCSEVVHWLNEYRVYVTKDCNSDSQIVGIYPYNVKQHETNQKIDISIVREALQCLDKAGESVAGYALDFGILETGEMALVEMNDGFSLGNYGLSDRLYTDLILARWEELIG